MFVLLTCYDFNEMISVDVLFVKQIVMSNKKRAHNKNLLGKLNKWFHILTKAHFQSKTCPVLCSIECLPKYRYPLKILS